MRRVTTDGKVNPEEEKSAEQDLQLPKQYAEARDKLFQVGWCGFMCSLVIHVGMTLFRLN